MEREKQLFSAYQSQMDERAARTGQIAKQQGKLLGTIDSPPSHYRQGVCLFQETGFHPLAVTSKAANRIGKCRIWTCESCCPASRIAPLFKVEFGQGKAPKI